MVPANSTFKGEIKVASRIVDYLSSGLYETPAACLKELINNSYDADATTVNVYIKPDADRIIIEDDGIGMSRTEFETHFSRVAESHKRDTADTTPSGRPKIGKIGIGFIAANEICDILEIHSTKEGSTELLIVEINFTKMRQSPEERRRENSDFAKADYEGSTASASAVEHYTRLFLKGVRKEARRVFSGASRRTGSSTDRSLYGLRPSSAYKQLADHELKSWDQFDAYSETLLRVALNVPVRYFESITPSKRWNERLEPFSAEVSRLNFTVKYDGAEIHKPIVFTAAAQRSFVQPFVIRGRYVQADGYFYAQSGVLKPQNLNGLLIRIRNSAVGEYDKTFLDYPAERGALFQGWISCELWASDELEDALNIDRRTLRQTHDAVVELRTLFHEELTKVISTVRRDLHGQSSARRRLDQAARQTSELDRLTSEGPTATRAGHRLVDDEREEPNVELARRYSASELYELAGDVAAESISNVRERRAFLVSLLERLLGR